MRSLSFGLSRLARPPLVCSLDREMLPAGRVNTGLRPRRRRRPNLYANTSPRRSRLQIIYRTCAACLSLAGLPHERRDSSMR